MKLTLDGLTCAPAQSWGAVRLVPLTRDEGFTDVRLALRDYGDDQWFATTRLNDKTTYLAYVPHGLVVQWAPDGSALPAVDTALGAREARRVGPVVGLHRMARGLARNALRLLPLHLAMEGYLALHFGGPDVAHRYWSRDVLRHGLDPRSERVTPGASVPGLGEALRVFERHSGQCGVLVFIGDRLASALVVGHPDDYAALHDALITDFYGSIFAQHGWAFRDVPELAVELEGTSIDAIRASLQRAREGWAGFARDMAGGLFPREVVAETVRTAGRFRLKRFQTGFRDTSERDGEHIGEALVDADDRLVYLKTYRLDRGQIRRGYLLSELGRCEWDAKHLADDQGHGDVARITRDLEAAGLGWMVRPPSGIPPGTR